MGQWVKAVKKEAIPEDTGYLVELDGRDIALFKAEGKVFAIDAHCAHQGGPLHEGALQGKNVTCPWHGWEFDFTTGVCGFNDSIKQQVFPVKEEGGDVYVDPAPSS